MLCIIAGVILVVLILFLGSRPGRYRLVGRDADGNFVELETRATNADLHEIAGDYLSNGAYARIYQYDGENLTNTYE